jgi:hypothetical protein
MTITPPCTVGSPIRAAIRFSINTVGDPIRIVSGGPTQVHRSVARAAGKPPISTVGDPGGRMGPPTCGIGGKPGVSSGHVCISPTLAAGGIVRICASIKDSVLSGRLNQDRRLCAGYQGSPAHTSTVRFLAKPCGSNKSVPPMGIAYMVFSTPHWSRSNLITVCARSLESTKFFWSSPCLSA